MRKECCGMKGTKKHKVGAALLAMMLLVLLVTSGCGASAKKDTLKVGVRDDIVGLGYLNPTTDNYYGLEIDIADRLAKDMGYKEVEYVTVQPDNRKDKLLKGEVDCLIAAYSISDVRKENFDFSDPYYKDQIKVMVQKSSLIENVQELKGKTIGVLAGVNTAVEVAIKMNELGLIDDFDRESFQADKYEGAITFESVESYNELSLALEEGRVDAICLDGSIAKAYMNDHRSFLEVQFEEQDYGVATQKGSELSKAVEKSMKKLMKNGTIDELIDKWD